MFKYKKNNFINQTIKTVAIQSLFFYIYAVQKKWYFLLLLLVFTVIGISTQKSITPNQEIVVQFPEREISSENEQQTIKAITQQLLSIGVKAVVVDVTGKGIFKITYFSTLPIAVVKSKLTHIDSDVINPSYSLPSQNNPSIPFQELQEDIVIAVFEIQKGAVSKSNLDGNLVALKFKSNRLQKPDLYACKLSFIVVTAHTKSYKNSIDFSVSLKPNVLHYAIPQVRAGPVS